MNKPPSSLREIFADAAEIVAPAARAAFLEAACRGDQMLRQRVEALLAAAERAGNFLRDPGDTTRMELFSEKPGDRIGRYRLLERIGRGGGGVVYLAEQEEPVRRRVALKVIKLGMDTQSVIARFEAERQALALMDHPHIAKVLDAGATETGRPFFVMELVSGLKLSDYCESHHLSLPQRLELFISICQAVQHAHQKGVIHRDLKPSNILVTEHEGVAVPKVIDFGIAKATGPDWSLGEGLTSVNQFIGTPAYMSPEQVEQGPRDMDTRSDIYSLGVILYELLAGQPPFDPQTLNAAGLNEMRRIIREVDPPRPSTTITRNLNSVRAPAVHPAPPVRLEAVPGDLDWIVMKCLEKDRTRRYESASGLAADLRRHLANEPISARPPTPLYQFQKMVRRHRVAATAAGVIALVLIGATLVSTQLAVRAYRAEQEQGRLRRVAEAEVNQSHQQLVRRYVAEGNRLVEQGRPLAGLPWLVEALQLESADAPKKNLYPERLRIAQLLSSAPTLRLQSVQGKWVQCVAFSPDGTRIATGSDDHVVRLSTVAGGGSVFTNLALPASVGTVAFSPDGTRLVAADLAGWARVWDATTGAALTPLLRAADFSATAVAPLVARLSPTAQFSPDGRWLLLAWGSAAAQLRDGFTGELIREFASADLVWHAAFNAAGTQVVTSSAGGAVQVWETATGQAVGRALPHRGMVAWSQFSAAGDTVLTTRERKFIQLWNWRTGEPVGPELAPPSVLFHTSLSPDGRQILAVSWAGMARLFEATTGQLVAEFQHDGGLADAAFSPDGRHFATACHDGNAWLWKISDPRTPVALLPMGDETDKVAFSADGKQLVTGGRGGRARVWKLISIPPGLRKFPSEEARWVEFDAPARRFVVAGGGSTGNLRVYDAASGQLLSATSYSNAPITRAHFSPDGTQLLFVAGQNVQVVDANTARAVGAPLRHPGNVHTALWISGGTGIMTAAADGVRQWHPDGAAPATLLPQTADVRAIALSPDGNQLATAQTDQTVRVWSPGLQQSVVTSWRAPAMIQKLAYAPDGRRLAVSAYSPETESVVELRDTATGALIGRPMVHRNELMDFEYSRTGRYLVTAGKDRTARVWDAATGMPISPWIPHTYTIRQALFSPDGEQLVTLGSRGYLRLWQSRTGEPLTAYFDFSRDGGDYRAQFSPDGRQLLFVTGAQAAWILSLEAETASLAELELLAKVMSCSEIEPASGLVPLDNRRLQAVWEELRALRSKP
jgi:eukaryotic-like serine/threonine-protein kinase